MRTIDWPLAITLFVVFVVMSYYRWRYFKSAAKRWGAKSRASTSDRGRGDADPR